MQKMLSVLPVAQSAKAAPATDSGRIVSTVTGWRNELNCEASTMYATTIPRTSAKSRLRHRFAEGDAGAAEHDADAHRRSLGAAPRPWRAPRPATRPGRRWRRRVMARSRSRRVIACSAGRSSVVTSDESGTSSPDGGCAPAGARGPPAASAGRRAGAAARRCAGRRRCTCRRARRRPGR